MKQVLQNLRTGATEVTDVPAPALTNGSVLIRTTATLISTGTERSLVQFGRAGWIDKARQQPEKLKSVFNKIKTDGLMQTLDAVSNTLDKPLALGYCNVGRVMAVGAGVSEFSEGDRVVSNGKHAEVVSVPRNLCAKIPDKVSDDEAAFTVIGAIALQGIRLVQPTLGESVVVTGLGLIGLVTVQLLRANGCRVLGIDFDPDKLALAKSLGAEVVDLSAGEDPIAAANSFSRGRGIDAVIITASTDSNEPVHQGAQMCRKRGRIVLVGVTGLELSRADFYEKELSFQVSCSYGPGRYDPIYEEKGLDYPVGFVRWTEQRNFEAVLYMMADGRLSVKQLISHRFPVADASRAYDVVNGSEPSLGILLDYPTEVEQPNAVLRRSTVVIEGGKAASPAAPPGKASVAFIGAGNYASAMLMKAFKTAGAEMHTAVSLSGLSGMNAARRFGFRQAGTDPAAVFADPTVNTVVIATRHDTHARLASEALEAGKHVFVEKPLALTLAELSEVESRYSVALRTDIHKGKPILTVGFNRRFAPQVVQIHKLLQGVREPKSFLMTVNAGAIPPSHWTQDPAVGGGRIVGEACHFIDLLRFLAGSHVERFEATAMGVSGGRNNPADSASITLQFADGSLGTILYLANGSKAFPKERLEVFAGGRVLQLDNFRRLTGYGWPGFRSMKLWRQDKGQTACAAAFVRAVESGSPPPIPISELVEVSRLSIEIADSLR
jgi:predicted dehydrogenase/threonine dehydrogenase-like Zn-dependent dehydrogenase